MLMLIRSFGFNEKRKKYNCLLFAALAIFTTLLPCSVESGWIDPDTSSKFHSTTAHTKSDTREYALVFSDEFETEGRSFADGQDPRWTAVNKNDYTNDALHYYRHENVKTMNGVLNITADLKDNTYLAFSDKTKKFYVDTKHVQSGMVQGWNKFCITGGIVEISAKLPGKSHVGGLWPALWLLGNLARATFVGSSDWVWPFSYDKCDRSKIHQQEINACMKVGHYGMKPGVGRGAPEIDLLEVMGGESGALPSTSIERPYFSSSLQVAPGVSKNRPIVMHEPKAGHWYEGLEYGNQFNTSLNPFFYGVTLVHDTKQETYQSDAISANTDINESYFKKQQVYRVEWEPADQNGNGGYVRWYLNGKFIFGVVGDSLNITGASIPREPMSMIMNTAVASSWGFPTPCPEGCDCSCYECGNSDCDCALPTGYCSNFPNHFEIEYVRVWQTVADDNQQVGCSTEDRPTDLFIKGHEKRYTADGDKHPLMKIQYGGAKCDSNLDCGGLIHGACSSSATCVCNEGFAGDNCLAHDGFDDHPYSSVDNSLFPVSQLLLPTPLVVMLLALLTAFCVSLYITVSRKRVEQKDLCQNFKGDTVSPTYEEAIMTGSQTASSNDGIILFSSDDLSKLPKIS